MEHSVAGPGTALRFLGSVRSSGPERASLIESGT
jgi:hypothetical protein